MLKIKNFSSIIKKSLMVSVLGLSVVTMASCKQDETPTLDYTKTYLSVQNPNNPSDPYKVTNGEVWNELKWSAIDLFDQKKDEVILKKSLKDKDPKPEYKERLKQYLIEDVHNFEFSLDGHDDEIKELDEKTKETNYQKYADEVYKNHYVSLTREQIVNALKNNDYTTLEPLYELYNLNLAKELLAKQLLEEEIEKGVKEAEEDDDENTVHYFSKSDIINKYRSEYLNQGDVDVVMIRFASEAEANNTLRSFGLKVKDNQFYFLTKTPENFNDYKTYYEDFNFSDAKEDEYLPLDSYYGNSMILQLYISMYNYIYTYRAELPNDGAMKSTTVDNRAITKDLINKYDTVLNITDKASDEARVNKLIEALKTTGNTEYIHYTSEQIKDIDSSLHSYIYKDLKYKEEAKDSEWVDKESDAVRYSTAPKAIGDAYYMVFKEKQDFDENIDKLNYDSEWNQVKDDDLYTKLKNNEELFNEIITDLTDDKITQTFIDDKINEKRKDVSVSIYDKSVEITYAVKNADYSKTLSKAPTNNVLASFKYEGETVNLDIKNDEKTGAWDLLELQNGVFVASKLISDKKIMDSDAYKDLAKPEHKEDIDNYYSSIEYILASFANDLLAQQGYPAAIGKYNFLMLYYHTADIDEIVNKVFKIAKASSEILVNYSSPEILNDVFGTYTKAAYNNFFGVTTKNLQVFIDKNEDGKPDEKFDYTELPNQSLVSEDLANLSYEDIAKQLIRDIYDRLLSSNDDTVKTLDDLVSKFNQSSRFNPKNTPQFDPNDYDPIGSEWLFSKYKKLGFAVKADELKVSNTSTDVDLAIRNHVKNVYTNNNFKDNKYLTSFLEDAHEPETIIKVNDAYSYLAITAIERPTSAKFEEYKDRNHAYQNIHIMYNGTLETISDAYNSNDELSPNQIKAYVLEKLAYETSNLLPQAISQSLANYCDPVLTRFLDSTTQAELVYKNVSADGNYEFADLGNGHEDNYNRFLQLRKINQTITDNYADTSAEEAAYNNFNGWWETIKNIEIGGTQNENK